MIADRRGSSVPAVIEPPPGLMAVVLGETGGVAAGWPAARRSRLVPVAVAVTAVLAVTIPALPVMLGRDGHGQGVHIISRHEETFGGETSCVTLSSDGTATGSSHGRGC